MACALRPLRAILGCVISMFPVTRNVTATSLSFRLTNILPCFKQQSTLWTDSSRHKEMRRTLGERGSSAFSAWRAQPILSDILSSLPNIGNHIKWRAAEPQFSLASNLLSLVSVTLEVTMTWKYYKWKIPEIKKSLALRCLPLKVTGSHLVVLRC